MTENNENNNNIKELKKIVNLLNNYVGYIDSISAFKCEQSRTELELYQLLGEKQGVSYAKEELETLKKERNTFREIASISTLATDYINEHFKN